MFSLLVTDDGEPTHVGPGGPHGNTCHVRCPDPSSLQITMKLFFYFLIDIYFTFCLRLRPPSGLIFSILNAPAVRALNGSLYYDV